MIKYDKLFELMKEKGITSYTLKKDNLVGQQTLTNLRHPERERGLDHRSINKLCKALNCQPGDLMEYVPDPEDAETSSDQKTE